jgi:hypothetical protein
LFHIEMVAMQGDTARAIRGPGEERPRKLPVELFGTVRPPFGLTEYHQWNRGLKLVFEQALMGRGVVEVHKRLMGLLKLQRRCRQRELISGAERLFSFLDCMKMLVKPTSQPLLSQSRQLQDKMGKTQGLEDFKIPPCIRNNMSATAAKLFKR